MTKKTMYFWGSRVGPWRNWGVWWRQKVYVGVCLVTAGDWEISTRDREVGYPLAPSGGRE